MINPHFLRLLLALFPVAGAAAADARYDVHYTAAFEPRNGVARASIETRPHSGRLIALDLAMPTGTYRKISGDGRVMRNGTRVEWQPPREGGTLRYEVRLAHRRDNGQFDSRIEPAWVITRGDRLFPPARVRATRGSRSVARLAFVLPEGWPDAETPFARISGGRFAVVNPQRRFDRPVGWIAVGDLASVRETIGATRLTVTSPRGAQVDHVATIAILRQALPAMMDVFGAPEKLLIVRGDDPMWRGGLSAPRSLWLHSDRPLLSENGTSTLLHELTHVLSGIRGAGVDDWIGEGLAEYYSLEIARRVGLISQQRFERALGKASASGETIASLRAAESRRGRTRKAVALFAALEVELGGRQSSLDELVQLLSKRGAVTLAELRTDVERLEGVTSDVLATVE